MDADPTSGNCPYVGWHPLDETSASWHNQAENGELVPSVEIDVGPRDGTHIYQPFMTFPVDMT